MKYVSLALVLFLIGCGKDENSPPLVNNELLGKWQLEAVKISPGDIVEDWTEVANGPTYEFRENGSYTDSAKTCGTMVNGVYSITNDILTLGYHCKSEAMETNFYMDFLEAKLILSNVGCIEECSYKYVKKE